MEFESGDWIKYQITLGDKPFLEVDGILVPVTLHPNSYATRLRQPVYGNEETGLVAEFEEGYKLSENAKIGRLIIKTTTISLS